MKIYHYHSDTGVFLGEGNADESPLEPGVWLVPAYATPIEPPHVESGYYCVYNGHGWELELIPAPEPEPVPDIEPNLTPDPALPVAEPLDFSSLTTEEKLLRYGFTIDELKSLLGLVTI